MLADAIRAEGYRLSKNRSALFWSVLFVPLMLLLLGIVTTLLTKSRTGQIAGELQIDLGMAGGALNLGQSLVDIVFDLANPVVFIFVLIGAATVWAGDYRWESWRLISARNSRANLILAKLAVVASLALMAMVALTLIGLVLELIKAVTYERALAFSMNGSEVGDVLSLWGLSWIRIVQVTTLGLLTAVLSRSLMAALFVPLVMLLAHAILPQALAIQGLMPDSWVTLLLSPDAAFNILKGLTVSSPASPVQTTGGLLATKATLGLALWTLIPIAGALALFQRQDLSKE